MEIDGRLVGRRVVVRHLLGGTGPSGGPAMNDVVGRLLALDEAYLRLERRDGTVAEVARDAVVTWKPVPERPRRTRRAAGVGVEELERIASRGWPAVESEPLGSWELRAAGGFTGRANSVLVAGDPGVSTSVALTAVRSFYADRGLPALAQVPVGSPHDAAFLTAGWRPARRALPGAVVQVADLARDVRVDPDARVDPVADDAWLSRYGRVEDPVTARAVLEGPATVGFVSLGPAIGRVVVTGEWAGLACVEVEPTHRRHGWAGRVVRTALAWAAQHGADKAYLQTRRENTAALALYAPFGFLDHHDYRYLEPTP